ncbi:MAG: [protein-PII] uridylyltransferase, partial [Pseudomonadota bacterium]|nr:[protein-PII] uridylyltransferase [Pseudomonadota bacterium]
MDVKTSEPELKFALKKRRNQVLAGAEKRLDGRNDGRTIVKYISASVDEILSLGWDYFSEENRSQVDVVGVGGYGRAELCPFSDWDILFLVPDRCDSSALESISKFTQLIWDVGGNLGHSVRTVSEAKKFFNQDHHARTAFLESRLIMGKGVLYHRLCSSESASSWDKSRRSEFCRDKIEECLDRHQKLGNTAFCMEPDCKNGKGALRDVSTIFWLSMAWYKVPAARQLIDYGVVSNEEFSAFVKARDFLWRVRTGLHLIAGRESDRLIFQYQLELAKRFRYRDNAKNGAVERFLKKYFLNVRTIADLSDIFLLHFQELIDPPKSFVRQRPSRYGLIVRGGTIEVADELEFSSDPLNLLRIFKEAQDSGCGLGSRILRIVRKSAKLLAGPFRLKKEASVVFLDILRSPEGVPKILRQMHETGVLGQFCPDFRRITGHGQFDRYHHYTVDAHTIAAVSYLRELSLIYNGNPSMVFAASLMKSLDRPELLYIAVIYHDIAKGMGGDHSEIGATLAKKFCARLGISLHDADFVAWLVLHHHRLSKTAQHYNLSDLSVIEEFSRFVGDRQHLIYLFLLTLVDVYAVGPGTLTDWKLHLFVQLFHATDDFLRTGRM